MSITDFFDLNKTNLCLAIRCNKRIERHRSFCESCDERMQAETLAKFIKDAKNALAKQ
jgi:hypothetical protein